ARGTCGLPAAASRRRRRTAGGSARPSPGGRPSGSPVHRPGPHDGARRAAWPPPAPAAATCFTRRPDTMGRMTDIPAIPEPCDLLVEAGHVVPVEPHGVVLEDPAAVPRPGGVLRPGRVAAHVYDPTTLLGGVADDLPRKLWMRQHLGAIEAAVSSPALVEAGVTRAIAELLRGGVTCGNENYVFT